MEDIIDRSWQGLALLTFLLLISCVAWWYYFCGHTVDDAGISFVYARNLALGYGAVYHPGFAPVEGFSNPVWTVLLSVFYFMGFENLPHIASILGLGFYFLALLLILYYGFSQLFPSLLFLCLVQLPLGPYWAVTGLENGLFSFLLCSCYLSCKRKEFTLLYGLLPVLILSRPEAILYALVFAIFHKGSRKVIAHCLIFFGFITLCRILYFHDIFPNTIWAKRGLVHSTGFIQNFLLGLQYILDFFRLNFGFSIWIIPVLIYLFVKRQFLLLSLFASHVLLLCLSGGDWMRGFRLISPFVPLGIYVLTQSIWALVTSFKEMVPFKLIIVLNLIFLLWFHWYEVAKRLDLPYIELEERSRRGQKIEAMLKSLEVEDPVLMDTEAGGTAWATEMKVCDMAGLTDQQFAHSRKRPYDFTAYLVRCKPHAIYTIGFWTQVSGFSKEAKIYSEYFPAQSQEYFGERGEALLLHRSLQEAWSRKLQQGNPGKSTQ